MPITLRVEKRLSDQKFDENLVKSKKKKRVSVLESKEKKTAYEREKKRKQRAKIYADFNLYVDFLEKQ